MIESDTVQSTLNELKLENDVLKAKLAEYTRPESEYLEEIASLSQQLHEANSYVDQVDVEAEQQYTELTSEIDELCTLVESKDKEIKLLKDSLTEQTRKNEQYEEQVEQQKLAVKRQTEIIDSLRDELDALDCKLKETVKDKERLASELVEVQKKADNKKGSNLEREVMMALEIEDVQRELNKQKEILASTSISDVVEKWERQVLDLENELSERNIIIHTQQAIINKLRLQVTPSPSRALHPHSGGSSSESFHSHILDDTSRSTLLNYILSDRQTQLANLYAVGRILELNAQEEKLLERYLSEKANLFS